MKILFISLIVPYPPDTGATVRIYNLIKYLSKRNDIHLIAWATSEEQLKYVPKLQNYCSSLEIVLKPYPKKSLLKLYFYAIHFFLKEMQLKITEAIKTLHIDVIHADAIYSAQYVHNLSHIPKVIVPCDANSLAVYQLYRKSWNPLTKLSYLTRWVMLKNFERNMYTKFDKCVVVSPKDREALKSHLPNLDISVIPNGVNSEYFKPNDQHRRNENIIFTGIMSFPPNVDAILYFCRDIFPLIQKKKGNVKLYIVGKDPVNKVKKLSNNKNITVTGYVPDIRSYISKCAVYVCPMRIGTGIKNKILEAMAMGIPIVATSASVEAIGVSPNRDIIIADDPKEFAMQTMRLLNDKELRMRLVKNARKLVETKYSWESTIAKYERVYRSAIEQNRKSNQSKA